jgi:hypothetical protein
MCAGRLNDWIKAKGFVTMTDVEWRLDSRLLTMARSLSRRLSHRAAVSHYGSCSGWGINCGRVIVRLAAQFIERPRPGFEMNLPYPWPCRFWYRSRYGCNCPHWLLCPKWWIWKSACESKRAWNQKTAFNQTRACYRKRVCIEEVFCVSSICIQQPIYRLSTPNRSFGPLICL